MTDPMDGFDELERLIERRLTAAPAPRAPETLLPRVMQAVRAVPAAETTGWTPRTLAWQVASAAALIVVVLGVVTLGPAISATPLFTAGRVLWRVVVEPVGLFFVMFLAAMGAACAVFATAWRHVAFGGLSR